MNYSHLEYLRARQSLEISAANAGNGTGINRNDLAKFEKGRFILTPEQKRKLFLFYQSQGFDFSLLEKESQLNDHLEVKEENLAVIRLEFGDKLANVIENLFQDAEHKIEALEMQVNAQDKNVGEVVLYSPEYLQLEKLLIEHFRNLELKTDFSFLLGESKESRSMKLVCLLALQYLRHLAASKNLPIEEHQDFKLMSFYAPELMDIRSLSEFADFKAFSIA